MHEFIFERCLDIIVQCGSLFFFSSKTFLTSEQINSYGSVTVFHHSPMNKLAYFKLISHFFRGAQNRRIKTIKIGKRIFHPCLGRVDKPLIWIKKSEL